MNSARTGGLALIGFVVLLLVGSMIGGTRREGERAAARDAAKAREDRIRVEVLNAAGLPGLARTATEQLRDGGYDVVYYGNARGFGRDTSMVLDRTGGGEHGRDVARMLDISRVLSRPDPTLYLEVTVVLGRDWSGIPADSLASQ